MACVFLRGLKSEKCRSHKVLQLLSDEGTVS